MLAVDAEAVGVVHDEETVELPSHFREFGKLGDVALHGVHAFEDEDFGKIACLVGEDFAKVFGVIV